QDLIYQLNYKVSSFLEVRNFAFSLLPEKHKKYQLQFKQNFKLKPQLNSVTSLCLSMYPKRVTEIHKYKLNSCYSSFIFCKSFFKSLFCISHTCIMRWMNVKLYTSLCKNFSHSCNSHPYSSNKCHCRDRSYLINMIF